MLPVIGESPTVAGLFHAFGFCGHGFQPAPGVGLVVSELIVDGETLTPLTLFATMQFENTTRADPERLVHEFDPSLGQGNHTT